MRKARDSRESVDFGTGSTTFVGAGAVAGPGPAQTRTQAGDGPAGSNAPAVPPLRVSLTMVVRDAETRLRNCLHSVADLFDEVIVVDAGSTDRTTEVARGFGARVFDFVWVDDWAAARNVALARATGDFAFWLDADETIDPAQREPLRALLGGLRRQDAAAYRFRLDPSSEVGRGDGEQTGECVRLFPVRGDVRWDSPNAAQILPALLRAGIPVRPSAVTIRSPGAGGTAESGRPQCGSRAGVAEMRSRAEFGAFLNHRGLLGTGVEIGVENGVFARCVLDRWRGERLYLVDIWQQLKDYWDVTNAPAAEQAARLVRTVQNVTPFWEKVRVIQERSERAAQFFADGSLDWIYLDANHEYTHVLQDLAAWAPKVKAGGVIAGHDFLDGVLPIRGVATVFGVKRAVCEFFAGQDVRSTEDRFPTWYVTKRCGPPRVCPERPAGDPADD